MHLCSIAVNLPVAIRLYLSDKQVYLFDKQESRGDASESRGHTIIRTTFR
jgi:hypothetical protein